MGIFILKMKGFTLINSLFSLSIYIVCIIMFVSLYNVGKKQIIINNQNYKKYLILQKEMETKICIENGIEDIIEDLP